MKRRWGEFFFGGGDEVLNSIPVITKNYEITSKSIDNISNSSDNVKMNFPILIFHVSSSSTDEVYEIELKREQDKLSCTCTCPAGQKKTHCKHRTQILNEDTSNITGGDINKVSIIPSMLEGTDVQEALINMNELHQQKEEIDKLLKSAKRKYSRVLHD